MMIMKLLLLLLVMGGWVAGVTPADPRRLEAAVQLLRGSCSPGCTPLRLLPVRWWAAVLLLLLLLVVRVGLLVVGVGGLEGLEAPRMQRKTLIVF